MSEAVVPDSPMANASTSAEGITQKSARLRAELKEWEKTFAAANGGRKAGREDIKNNASIAAKYKKYNRLRSLLSSSGVDSPASGSRVASPTKAQHREGRPSLLHDATTPRKSSKHIFATPRHNKRTTAAVTPSAHPSQLDPYDSPSTLRKLFSPSFHNHNSPQAFRTALGPTPQRDGQVLGLFDLLSASGGSNRGLAQTPSSRKIRLNDEKDAVDATPSASAKRKTEHITQTPSRKRGADVLLADEAEEETPRGRRHFSRTPMSMGKKFLFSTFFTTPTKLRLTSVEENGKENSSDRQGTQAGEDATPKRSLFSKSLGAQPSMSPSKSGLFNRNLRSPSPLPIPDNTVGDTPSFLRRSTNLIFDPTKTSQNSHEEGRDLSLSLSPIAVRLPAKPAGRGLTQLVKGLRDLEDERMEEEMEAMREAEAEMMGFDEHGYHAAQKPKKKKTEQPQMHKSQAVDDDGFLIDEEAMRHLEKDKNADGKEDPNALAPRVWKKKGQKRTTRRVNMRPNRARPAAEPEWNQGGEDEEEAEEDADPATEAVEEYGFDPADFDDLSDDDLSDDDLSDDELTAPARTPTKRQLRPQKSITEPTEVEEDFDPEDDGARTPPSPPSSPDPEDQTADPEFTLRTSSLKQKLLQASRARTATFNAEARAEATGKNKKGKGGKERVVNGNAASHMNFRSLKIKNKNSKAKGRFGGRRMG